MSLRAAVRAVFAIASLFVCSSAALAADWQEFSVAAKAEGDAPYAYRAYRVDLQEVRAELDGVRESAGDVFVLPTPDGGRERFRLVESSILSPEMQAARPQYRSYRGVGIDDPSARARISLNGSSFSAIVRAPGTMWLVSERDDFERGVYVAVRQSDVPRPRFDCGVDDLFDLDPLRPEVEGAAAKAPLGENLVTYKFAITGTGEFVQYHGSLAAAEADLTTLVGYINAVYEDELGVFFQLVDVNLYSDPATDPFTDGTALNDLLLSQNNTALRNKLGSAGYDVGHIVSRSPGIGPHGLAYVGQQCNSSYEGRGGTLAATPGATSVLSVALHEAGHQLGATHSFNSTEGGCGGNRSAGSAYEIGSGITIMSYAGLCGSEDISNVSYSDFNAGALYQIATRIANTSSCGTRTPTGNTGPTIDAGPSLSIPRGTAFELVGTATDPNGDPMTYRWEQYDLGVASPPVDPASGPLFRNYTIGSDLSRSFPLYSAYRRGVTAAFEQLPSVNRTMNFRFVVRDNSPLGSATEWDTQTITVSGDPFVVTAPNGGETIAGGASVDVTWTVGGGSVASDVRILFSEDEGISWAEIVASTPNDGVETISGLCSVTTEGRIRIEPIGNVFFDISNANFTVTKETTPPVITCPAPITVTATSAAGISKDDPALAPFFEGVSATDNCDPNPVLGNFAGPTLPIGDTVIAFTATDASGNLAVCTATVTVEEEGATDTPRFSRGTGLVQVRPNPFNPRTVIDFELARAQAVRLDVVDLRGRRVASLFEGTLGEGPHSHTWTGVDESGRSLPSGTYFVRLRTESGVFTLRAALLK